MSKKNKNKHLPANQPAENTGAKEAKTETASNDSTENTRQEYIKSDFKRLGAIVIILLAVLIGLYYYDQQTHILKSFTSKLFSLF